MTDLYLPFAIAVLAYPIAMPVLTAGAIALVAVLSRGGALRFAVLSLIALPVLTHQLAPSVATNGSHTVVVPFWLSFATFGSTPGNSVTDFVGEYAATVLLLLVCAFVLRRYLPVSPSGAKSLADRSGRSSLVLNSWAELAAFLIATWLTYTVVARLSASSNPFLIHVHIQALGHYVDRSVLETAAAAQALFLRLIGVVVALLAFIALRNHLAGWLRFVTDINGRASRRDYWVRYWIPMLLLAVAAVGFDYATGFYSSPKLSAYLGSSQLVVFVLGTWLFTVVVVKRCHDINRSGWYTALCYVPIIGLIWLLVLVTLIPGTSGENVYGKLARTD